MPNYGNLPKASQTGKTGGYKPALYFSPIEDITAWSRPTNAPAALGDKVKITAAHTWAANLGAYKWDAQIHTVKLTTATVGEEGAYELEHTAELVVLGDNPSTFEQMVQALNDDKVIWLKDADCIENDSYVQLGDDCVPVTASIAFDGKTTKEGQKGYTVTIKCKKKFFYLAALDVTFV